MEMLSLSFKRLAAVFSDIELPAYSTKDSSGMDIRAALMEDMVIESGGIAMVPTNLAVELPKGFEIQVRPRSGLAAEHGVTVLNTPGTIDADYRGEIKIILANLGKNHFTIKRGDRIAQMVIGKVYQAQIIEVDTISDTERGENGFGSSGVK